MTAVGKDLDVEPPSRGNPQQKQQQQLQRARQEGRVHKLWVYKRVFSPRLLAAVPISRVGYTLLLHCSPHLVFVFDRSCALSGGTLV